MIFENLRTSNESGIVSVSLSVTFPTGGWSSPKLLLVEYVTPPADGIQELSVSAVSPPRGTDVTQAFEKWPLPVEVSFEAPIWYKGVAVLNADGTTGVSTI